MKFKAISRSELEHTRERRDDVVKVFRNPDPELHPFERAREYTRAVNATKLDKMFSKPLIGSLEGHTDSVWCMSTSPKSLVAFVSGACDGQIKVWDLAHKKTLWTANAHRGIVQGVSIAHDGATCYSCGDDKTIKQWSLTPDAALTSSSSSSSSSSSGKNDKSSRMDDSDSDSDSDSEDEEEEEETKYEVAPISTLSCSYTVLDIDCHIAENKIAACGEQVDIFDSGKLEPVHSFSWGSDAIKCVKFNPAETNLLATTGGDRSICFYDIRQNTPLRKVILSMKSNSLCWNPMEPLNLIAANEDHNVYQFDMRKLERAIMVHKDHVGAVMDCSFSPTGRMFSTASYDNTIRIFKYKSGRSHQVYHTRRMQQVFCTEYTRDSNFILSGSDDTNIRIWKADASKTLATMLPRERSKRDYNRKIMERYKHVKELNRLRRNVLEPKMIKKERSKKHVMADAQRRKVTRRLKNDPNSTKPQPERQRKIVKQLE